MKQLSSLEASDLIDNIWFKGRVRSFTEPDLLWKRSQLAAEESAPSKIVYYD